MIGSGRLGDDRRINPRTQAVHRHADDALLASAELALGESLRLAGLHAVLPRGLKIGRERRAQLLRPPIQRRADQLISIWLSHRTFHPFSLYVFLYYIGFYAFGQQKKPPHPMMQRLSGILRSCVTFSDR